MGKMKAEIPAGTAGPVSIKASAGISAKFNIPYQGTPVVHFNLTTLIEFNLDTDNFKMQLIGEMAYSSEGKCMPDANNRVMGSATLDLDAFLEPLSGVIEGSFHCGAGVDAGTEPVYKLGLQVKKWKPVAGVAVSDIVMLLEAFTVPVSASAASLGGIESFAEKEIGTWRVYLEGGLALDSAGLIPEAVDKFKGGVGLWASADISYHTQNKTFDWKLEVVANVDMSFDTDFVKVGLASELRAPIPCEGGESVSATTEIDVEFEGGVVSVAGLVIDLDVYCGSLAPNDTLVNIRSAENTSATLVTPVGTFSKVRAGVAFTKGGDVSGYFTAVMDDAARSGVVLGGRIEFDTAQEALRMNGIFEYRSAVFFMRAEGEFAMSKHMCEGGEFNLTANATLTLGSIGAIKGKGEASRRCINAAQDDAEQKAEENSGVIGSLTNPRVGAGGAADDTADMGDHDWIVKYHVLLEMESFALFDFGFEVWGAKINATGRAVGTGGVVKWKGLVEGNVRLSTDMKSASAPAFLSGDGVDGAQLNIYGKIDVETVGLRTMRIKQTFVNVSYAAAVGNPQTDSFAFKIIGWTAFTLPCGHGQSATSVAHLDLRVGPMEIEELVITAKVFCEPMDMEPVMTFNAAPRKPIRLTDDLELKHMRVEAAAYQECLTWNAEAKKCEKRGEWFFDGYIRGHAALDAAGAQGHMFVEAMFDTYNNTFGIVADMNLTIPDWFSGRLVANAAVSDCENTKIKFHGDANLTISKAAEAQLELDGRYACASREPWYMSMRMPHMAFAVGGATLTVADARLVALDTTTMKVDQSALTGESVAARKDCKAVKPKGDREIDILGKKNMLFSGTTCSSGTVMGIVTATGMNTEVGVIAGALKDKSEEEIEATRNELVAQLAKAVSEGRASFLPEGTKDKHLDLLPGGELDYIGRTDRKSVV